jgi:hypothetical protein
MTQNNQPSRKTGRMCNQEVAFTSANMQPQTSTFKLVTSACSGRLHFSASVLALQVLAVRPLCCRFG